MKITSGSIGMSIAIVGSNWDGSEQVGEYKLPNHPKHVCGFDCVSAWQLERLAIQTGLDPRSRHGQLLPANELFLQVSVGFVQLRLYAPKCAGSTLPYSARNLPGVCKVASLHEQTATIPFLGCDAPVGCPISAASVRAGASRIG